MLLFGHHSVPVQPFYPVKSDNDIDKTPSNSTIYIEYSIESLEVVRRAVSSGVAVAIKVNSVVEAIVSENLGVKYLISEFELSKEIEEVVDNYLFVSRNLSIIDVEDDILKLASAKIDGAVFRSFLENR